MLFRSRTPVLPELPSVAESGLRGFDVNRYSKQEQAIAWGADEYLAKPFSAELLVRTVRDIAGAPTDLDGVAAALV